jgi:hypothetical protein
VWQDRPRPVRKGLRLTRKPSKNGPKGAAATVPVRANGRNPSTNVGRLPAPGPPTSRGSVRRLAPTAKRHRVLVSVQPFNHSLSSTEAAPVRLPSMIIASAIGEENGIRWRACDPPEQAAFHVVPRASAAISAARDPLHDRAHYRRIVTIPGVPFALAFRALICPHLSAACSEAFGMAEVRRAA